MENVWSEGSPSAEPGSATTLVADGQDVALEARGVSVIVPAFDAEETLREAIDSVWLQEFVPLEILLVDDGSRDRTPLLSEEFAARGVRVVRLPENRGPAAARNVALRLARGRYVAFLDADDAWLSGKLAKQVRAIESDPDVTLVSCDSLYVTWSGARLRRSHESRPPADGGEAWKTLLAYNFAPTPTVLARRDDVLAVGGFDESLGYGEDLDLWIRLALRGRVVALDEVLVRIREWPGSLTRRRGHVEPAAVLPYVKRYLAQEREQLSADDVARILGRRFFDSGVCLFYSGASAGSLRYFWRSLRHGFSPLQTLRYVPRVVVSMLSRGKYPRHHAEPAPSNREGASEVRSARAPARPQSGLPQ